MAILPEKHARSCLSLDTLVQRNNMQSFANHVFSELNFSGKECRNMRFSCKEARRSKVPIPIDAVCVHDIFDATCAIEMRYVISLRNGRRSGDHFSSCMVSILQSPKGFEHFFPPFHQFVLMTGHCFFLIWGGWHWLNMYIHIIFINS